MGDSAGRSSAAPDAGRRGQPAGHHEIHPGQTSRQSEERSVPTRYSNADKVFDSDGELFLKQVREVVPTQLETVLQRNAAKGGHPEVSFKVDPAIFVVMLKGESKNNKMFRFYDDTLADRVSKALQHAVELCGGGNQEPF